MTIRITSAGGRIGPFWWFNSDQIPKTKMIPLVVGCIDFGTLYRARLVQWGTCGIGWHVRIAMEPIDD